MGSIPPPFAQPQRPARNKTAKKQHEWSEMVRDYDKFTAMKDSIDKLPTKRFTKDMITLKTAIGEHFAAPELFEAFEVIYAAHPNWEMPEWVTEKLKAQPRQGKQDTPMKDEGQEVGSART
ncbi:hypothetical protein E8E12_010779 [Didymella heteroderae]|uniref:Uncharacterized protein n=1 Tax=Didymella heteroderae TaxID=1769908 RepID=A0A9P4WX19_9PLEO|nr:hypothetical protein E8E12_010779 [Didymella heteroderae]